MIEDRDKGRDPQKEYRLKNESRAENPNSSWRVFSMVLQVIVIFSILQMLIPVLIMEKTLSDTSYLIIVLVGSLLTGFIAFAVVLKRKLSLLERKIILYGGEIGGLIIMYVYYSWVFGRDTALIFAFPLIMSPRYSFRPTHYRFIKYWLIYTFGINFIALWFFGLFLTYLLGGFLYVKLLDRTHTYSELVRIDNILPVKILVPFLLLSIFGVGYRFTVVDYHSEPLADAYLASTIVLFGFLMGYGVGLVVSSLLWGESKTRIGDKQEIRELLFILISGFYLISVIVGTYLDFYSSLGWYLDRDDYDLFVCSPFLEATLKALFFFFGGYYVLKRMERMLTQRMIGS